MAHTFSADYGTVKKYPSGSKEKSLVKIIMGKTLYIFSSATLMRKDNTLLMQVKGQNVQYLPVASVEEIFVMGDVELNKGLLELLTENGIVIHFFDYYGTYTGTYYPPESKNSGQIFLIQAAHCLSEHKRHELAAAFVTGAIGNMIRLVNYYQRRYEKIHAQDITEYLKFCMAQAPNTLDINSLMGIEGTARSKYYEFFDRLISDEDFKIIKRVRRPPNNKMNALISFINSICYAETLTQIYHTHLDPRISFLHSPSDRRISLNLDISEIFKPILVDRLIFSLVNRRMIKASDFKPGRDGGIYASRDARKVIAEAWEKSLRNTITYPATEQRMGWRRVIRSEAFKVQKYIVEGVPYEPFVLNW